MVAAEKGDMEAEEEHTHPLAAAARLAPAADHAAGSSSTPGQPAYDVAMNAARCNSPSANQLADTESGVTPGRARHLQGAVQPKQPRKSAGKVPGCSGSAAAAASSDGCALFDTVGCVIVDSAGKLSCIRPFNTSVCEQHNEVTDCLSD